MTSVVENEKWSKIFAEYKSLDCSYFVVRVHVMEYEFCNYYVNYKKDEKLEVGNYVFKNCKSDLLYVLENLKNWGKDCNDVKSWERNKHSNVKKEANMIIF